MTANPLASLQQHAAPALHPGEAFLAGIRGRQEAAAIPITGAGAFIGVTSERVLVFASGFGLHPTELLGAIDREGLILSTEEYRAGLVKKARLRLLDGDRTVVDAVCSVHNPDLQALRDLLAAG